MSKRKRTATAAVTSTPTLPPPPQDAQMSSIATSPEALNIKYNNPGDHCFDLFDAEGATRASPDSPLTSPPPSEELGLWEVELENGDDDEGFKPELHDESPVEEEIVQGSRGKKKRKTATGTATGGKKQTTKNKKVTKKGKKTEQDEEEEGMIEDVKLPPTKKKSKPKKVEGGEEDDEAPVERSLPVNSDYLPLPWKGRLGYVRKICPPSIPSIPSIALDSLFQGTTIYR